MEWLIQYGRAGYVGRFRWVESAEASGAAVPLQRGDAVVIRTQRGIELGSVLCPAQRPAQALPLGELLRLANADDREHEQHLRNREANLLHDFTAQVSQQQLPVMAIDVEVLFDGQIAVVELLPWGECDLSPVVEALCRQHGLVVQLYDLTQVPQAKLSGDTPTCGKPDCGSTSGGGCSSCGSGTSGCSSGSCSRGQVKDADDLTRYFAHLRQQMESQSRRTPLV